MIPDIEVFPIEDQCHYPCSHKQTGKALLSRLKNECVDHLLLRELGAFNIYKRTEVMNLDVALLKVSFQQLLQRHDVLRTTFRIMNGEVRQVIQPVADNTGVQCFITSGEKAECDSIVDRLIGYEFDFFSEIPVRLGVIADGTERSVLILTVNHIASDHYSMEILESELIRIYQNGGLSLTLDRREPGIQLRDYAVSERKVIADGDYWSFWRKHLGEDLPCGLLIPIFRDGVKKTMQTSSYKDTLTAELQAAFPNSGSDYLGKLFGVVHRASSFEGSMFRFFIDEDTCKDMRAFAGRRGKSMVSVMIAALFSVLGKVSGKSDLVIAMECAIRNEKLNGVLGWLANTVLLRQKIDPGNSFEQLVSNTFEEIMTCINYRALPFEKILLDIDRSIDSFATMYVNYVNNTSSGILIKDFSSSHIDGGLPYFDMDFFLTEYSNGVDVLLRYKSALFDRDCIEMISRLFLGTTSLAGTIEKFENSYAYTKREDAKRS